MEHRFTISDATLSDGLALLATGDIRQADRDEWVAASLMSLKAAMLASFAEDGKPFPGGIARVARHIDGTPAALWGVNPVEERPGVGVVWLIGTSRAQRDIARSLHHVWKDEWARITATGLTQFVAITLHTNTKHHAWLKVLGFRRVEYTGPASHLFQCWVKQETP